MSAPPEDILAEYEGYSSPDWDSYGAAPITADTLAAARHVLAFLLRDGMVIDAAPGADGTIGLELILPDSRELWIDIGPGKRLGALIPKSNRRMKATGAREAPSDTEESTGKVDTPPSRSASALHVLGRVGSARADTGGREGAGSALHDKNMQEERRRVVIPKGQVHER